MDEADTIVDMPIDGVLDLHTFQPKEAASVVDEYLRVCHEQGIHEVKVIHGKGKGVLLRTVHALLEQHPLVQGFKLDTEGSGWGATIVFLKKNTEGRRQETE
ncbi:MAG: Smr/MutS family protein [Desulfobacterota bacterium]|nr:Smr/MutS family protein [Thermodesulfobacteriota bacterium]